MAKRYKKLQPKLRPLPFIIMGVIIVVFVVFLIMMTPSAKKRFETAYNARGANLPKDHVFVEISYKDFEKKVEAKENFVVYIGYPDCQGCIGEVNYYDTYFKSELNDSIQSIYYLNATKLKDEQVKVFQTSLHLEEFKTPQLLYYHEGSFLYSRNDSAYTSVSTKAQGQIQAFFQAVYQKQ